MAVLRTRATLRQIRAVDSDAMKDIHGNEVLEVGVVASGANHLKISNAQNGFPKLEAVGASTDVNLLLKAKGNAVIAIGADGANFGTLEIQNQQAGGFQIKPQATSNLYTMTYPQGAPSELAFMKINSTGDISFAEGSPSSFNVVGDTGSATIIDQSELLIVGSTNQIDTVASTVGSTGIITLTLDPVVHIQSGLHVPQVESTGGTQILVFGTEALPSSTFKGDANFEENVTVLGNLTVQGTTTTINSVDVLVKDKDIIVGASAATSTAANGAGILVTGTGVTSAFASWIYEKSLTIAGTSSTGEGWESKGDISISAATGNIFIDTNRALDKFGSFFEQNGLGLGLKADNDRRAALAIEKDEFVMVDATNTATLGATACKEIHLNSTGAGFGEAKAHLQVYLNGILQKGVEANSVGTKLNNGTVDFAFHVNATAGNLPKIFIPLAEVSDDDLVAVYYVV